MSQSKRRRFWVCWEGFVCGRIRFNQPGRRRIWAGWQAHAVAVVTDQISRRHRLNRLRLIGVQVCELRPPVHSFVQPAVTNPRLNGGSSSHSKRPSTQYPLFDRQYSRN